MSVDERRRELVMSMFPEGIPRIWCPPITQYDMSGKMDEERIRKHLHFLCRSVKTFLLFGSTGDGWELTEEEKEKMLLFYANEAEELHFQMLIGVLEPERKAAVRRIEKWVAWMKAKSGEADVGNAMRKFHVCGFTVCAPTGADLAQKIIREELADMLELGYPTVLYQLPQITLNEMSPETVKELSDKYPNFYMFKDTSGSDHVRLADHNYRNVFFVRGAEGDYGKWSSYSGGCYDGFLLSSANTFGEELGEVLKNLSEGQLEKAYEQSKEVSDIIRAVFDETSELVGGNVFANANKCIDHVLAYGEDWEKYSTPMRHCGEQIPKQYVQRAYETLKVRNKVPVTGYCL